MHKGIHKLMNFGVVGILATAIDFGLLTLLTEAAHINPVLSAGISFVVSLLFNYWASMRYVFTRKAELSRTHEMTLFVVLSMIGLSLNELLMWAGITWLNLHYLLVKIVATAAVMVWNYWSRHRWLDAD